MVYAENIKNSNFDFLHVILSKIYKICSNYIQSKVYMQKNLTHSVFKKKTNRKM